MKIDIVFPYLDTMNIACTNVFCIYGNKEERIGSGVRSDSLVLQGRSPQPAGGEQQTQLTIYEHTEPLVLDGQRDGKGRRGLYIRLMGHQLSPYELYAA